MKINSAFWSKKKRVKSNKKTALSSNDTEKSFEKIFKTDIQTDCHQTIESLMNDLKEREQRFLDKQNWIELSKYKQKVQQILKLILKEGFKTQTLTRRRRDRADYLIIKDIDNKLLNLTRVITNKNNKAFNLMKEIEEIRGILCDLIH